MIMKKIKRMINENILKIFLQNEGQIKYKIIQQNE